MMFDLELTKSDKEWLQRRYPGLNSGSDNGIEAISGKFRFDADFRDQRIIDQYTIRIEMRPSEASDLPTVFETDSRISLGAEVKGKSLADLHTYADGSACLCLKLAEAGYFPNGFALPAFIQELVLPYFYAQSYFEIHGKWPWDTLSHGILGWIEWYRDQEPSSREITYGFLEKLKATQSWHVIQKELSKKNELKGHQRCICGSGRRYRDCHESVFSALWNLRRDAQNYGIEI